MRKRQRPVSRSRKNDASSSGHHLLVVASVVFVSLVLTKPWMEIPSEAGHFGSVVFPVVTALPELKKTSSSVVRTRKQQEARDKLKKSLAGSAAPKDNSIEEHGQESGDSFDGKGEGSDDLNSGPHSVDSGKNDKFSDGDEHGITIESFLTLRKFSLRKAIRSVCIFLIAASSLQCFRSSGTPYKRTVWQIVYGDGLNSRPVDSILTNYVPSTMDCKIAQLILASNDDFNIMLPPAGMPSAGPLLGLVASVAMHIGLTMLLPRWSTHFRVLLDYARVDRPFGDSKNPSHATSRHSTNPQTSVLVRFGSRSAVNSGRGKQKHHQVVPLQPSSVSTIKEFSKRKKQARKKKQKKTPSTKNNINITSSPTDIESYGHPFDYYFEVDHVRIYCDPDTKECTYGGPKLHEARLSDLKQIVRNGGVPKAYRKSTVQRYEPYNRFQLATPTLREAFFERISSPLVVIQLIGKLVSLLEEGMGALFSMCMTLGQHYWNAQQSIISAKQLGEEVQSNLQDDSECQVTIWKVSKQKWEVAKAGDLLPGDIFRLQTSHTNVDSQQDSKTQTELIVPVDALVLKGQCLTNEAILTGESVPQIKTPLDFDDEPQRVLDVAIDSSFSSRCLDLQKDRSSILFAGTTLFHTRSSRRGGAEQKRREDSQMDSSLLDEDEGITCLALRTGTYSSKGKLLKVLKGGTAQHVGAISNEQSEQDAIRIVATLSICAAISCVSLFLNKGAPTVSPFRRVIQCSRIALASIPSDLPLALATVARSCSNVLRLQSDVVCSEPGSLLTAAYIDTVVFDKTGTLTADTQSLKKVTSISSLKNEHTTNSFQQFVLAGCHSLIHLQKDGKESLVGDPLDQVGLKYTQWKYNRTLDCYDLHESSDNLDSLPMTEPVRFWQICSFPFDPTRRLSSAIVLLQRKNANVEIWRLTKGSPDTMVKMFTHDTDDFDTEFMNRTQELEMQGYRSIALGAENLTNSSLAETLFPRGLSSVVEAVFKARINGVSIHRSSMDTSGLNFCGFCCFEASVRQSSKRIINELSGGGLKCIMLTGDSVDAAISVANKVNIFSERKIAVLERVDNSGSKQGRIAWRILTSRVTKSGSFRILHHKTKFEEFNLSSSKKYLKLARNGKCALAANGHALEFVLHNEMGKAKKLIMKNMALISIVARATPELKKLVIETLKQECGKRVMMCGDGVNDVAAIQNADVAASLLTGFGAENRASGIDIDDERRMIKLQKLNIGSNRGNNARKRERKEANERISKEIQKCRKEIDKRASSRTRTDLESSENQYTFEDMKEMISVTMLAARKERLRSAQLKKGGGDAARILAEERQAQISATTYTDSDDLDTQLIKPSEASLVSSFSCLHPSVDGIDAILRQGIATAASALSTQQGICLHSMMSCFHLATLYRDGFRYGKHMFNVEIFFYMILENARNKASCTPRPRLPKSVLDRPADSIFQIESTLQTVLHTVIHLSCMRLGVRYAKSLENGPRASSSGGRIRLNSLHGGRSKKLEKLMEALSNRSVMDNIDGQKNLIPFFQRAPFRSNYETNCVFIFSILQSALSALVNHKGSNFHHSILESQDLCKTASATLIFVIICISGKLAPLTNFLEVKPLPSRRSKLVFLGIMAMNVAACLICRCFAETIITSFQPRDTTKLSSSEIFSMSSAADHEEKLLREERRLNTSDLRVVCALILYLLMDILRPT